MWLCAPITDVLFVSPHTLIAHLDATTNQSERDEKKKCIIFWCFQSISKFHLESTRKCVREHNRTRATNVCLCNAMAIVCVRLCVVCGVSSRKSMLFFVQTVIYLPFNGITESHHIGIFATLPYAVCLEKLFRKVRYIDVERVTFGFFRCHINRFLLWHHVTAKDTN